MVPCALRAWSETESRAFSSLSCASRGVCVLRCHLPCVPGDLAQCGQTGQQQEPHASAGREPSAQAQEAPSEGRASPGAPWDAPGRCLQRGAGGDGMAPAPTASATRAGPRAAQSELGRVWALEPPLLSCGPPALPDRTCPRPDLWPASVSCYGG